MSTDDNGKRIEYSDAGYPIEIYSEERIREFLAEDGITPDEKERIEDKLRQPNIPKQ